MLPHPIQNHFWDILVKIRSNRLKKAFTKNSFYAKISENIAYKRESTFIKSHLKIII